METNYRRALRVPYHPTARFHQISTLSFANQLRVSAGVVFAVTGVRGRTDCRQIIQNQATVGRSGAMKNSRLEAASEAITPASRERGIGPDRSTLECADRRRDFS